MAGRLVIPVEFSKNSIEDLKLYARLRELTAPGAVIKDILKGKLPAVIIQEVENEES